MPTTTIRLSEALKARVAAAAKRADQSVHSYLLDAIDEKTVLDEQRAGFHDEAERRYATLVSSGNSIRWEDMRRYLRDRARNKTSAPPVACNKTG
jgi:predicted transcriptional regulator